MSSLVNENVEHIKYGKGIVVSESIYSVDIVFNSNQSRRSFLYPESFEKFLRLDNENLQNECLELAICKKDELEKELLEKQKEQERLNEEQKAKMILTGKVAKGIKRPKKVSNLQESN